MSIPVSKTLEEVRADLFGRISTVQQEGWLPASLNLNRGPIRGMIELWAWGLFQLYKFLFLILKQCFPESATGKWLDLHCAQVEVERLSATKATGAIHFTRTGSAGNVPIPAGRICRTQPDGAGNVYRFITDAAAVLPEGTTEVAVAVTAEEYGSASNVTVNAISELITPVVGVDSIENRADWLVSEGTDEEADAALRERYFLAWAATNGSTKYAYESWARSVTGVAAVRILDQHPRGQGTVDVVVKSTAGIPTQELIDAVDAVVQADKPINDDVLTKAPTAVPVEIDAEIEFVSGNAVTIQARADSRLRALFDEGVEEAGVTALQIGEDLPLDRLIAAVMGISGVKKINWTLPVADVAVPDDGLATLNSLTLTTTQASEE